MASVRRHAGRLEDDQEATLTDRHTDPPGPDAPAHFVLYVSDQEAAAAFYARVLAVEPRLDVPGMTEFALGSAVLGLMPESAIRRLLGPALPDPASASGIPRAELYLLVDDPAAYHARALAAGASERRRCGRIGRRSGRLGTGPRRHGDEA